MAVREVDGIGGEWGAGSDPKMLKLPPLRY